MVSNGDIFTFSSMLIFWLFWRKTLLIKAFFVFFDVVLPLTFSYTPNKCNIFLRIRLQLIFEREECKVF